MRTKTQDFDWWKVSVGDSIPLDAWVRADFEHFADDTDFVVTKVNSDRSLEVRDSWGLICLINRELITLATAH